jgi:hypothetical protein
MFLICTDCTDSMAGRYCQYQRGEYIAGVLGFFAVRSGDDGEGNSDDWRTACLGVSGLGGTGAIDWHVEYARVSDG